MRRLSPLPAAAAALAVWALSLPLLRLWPSRQPPEAECRADTVEETLVLTGHLSRPELSLPAHEGPVRLVAARGERLPAGAVLALCCPDARSLFRAKQLLRLERVPAGGVRGVDELRRALARRDFDALYAAREDLRAFLGLPAPDRSRERAELAMAVPEDWLLRAPVPGVLLGEDGGRLLTGHGWELVLDGPEPRLADRSVTLRLPDGTELPARGDGEGERLLCDRPAPEGLPAGTLTVTAVLHRWEGFRLPAAALREEDGRVFVLRTAGPLTLRAEVTVLCRRGEDVLVAAGDLRDGMRVRLQTDK